ncbi:lamin tail domain-containing protein [Dactylosporangium siamense]|uniref:LTD domain-containing protein n=1 Tax=Dactylosporangium siamense TaxID=685454 RepID=A0A919PK80_9ACTN|nr:lamin tail domain-containing protein [Dactylosporangium siamense]GIG44000.1 hypothetical protein Dsi01nite_020410 [Dactylosporangium siamense]
MRIRPSLTAGLAAALAVPLLTLAAPAAHAAGTGVRINEVESSGGSPGDWVELTNTGTATVSLAGWVIKDNDDDHAFVIGSGVSLAPGGYLAVDVESAYGLGSSDSVRLYEPGGALADSYSWSSHASSTYGRCPNGTGGFVATTAATKNAPNACPPPPPATWPGGSAVANADASNAFGENLSGLSYESASVVWAVRNGAGTLYRLTPSGSTWQKANTYTLRYANGSGDPDAEGVVVTPDGIMVATERDNSKSGTSLQKILRYNPSGSTVSAAAEWNLTADLPSAAANSGLEAITWVPDTALVAAGFRDEHTGGSYSPASYANHGTGLYFVGAEATGTVYAYALNLSGTGYTRVAAFPSGLAAVMDLEYEPSTGRLWATCDDTCSGRSTTLTVGAQGRFTATATYNRPSGMSNYNNEGLAFSPVCSGGTKQVLWADDSNDGSHALRSGTLSC